MTSDLKIGIISPLNEKTRTQQETIEKLSERMNKQKEYYVKELDKTQRKLAKVMKQAREHSETIVSLQDKLGQVQKQVESEQSKNICILCCTKPRDTVLLPCMHFLFCLDCTTSLTEQRCPTCRTTTHGKLQCILQP